MITDDVLASEDVSLQQDKYTLYATPICKFGCSRHKHTNIGSDSLPKVSVQFVHKPLDFLNLTFTCPLWWL